MTPVRHKAFFPSGQSDYMADSFNVHALTESYEGETQKLILEAIASGELNSIRKAWEEVSNLNPVWTKERLLDSQLGGTPFERLVYRCFNTSNDATLTKQTGDGGCDVLINIPSGGKKAVEAKHKTVGSNGKPHKVSVGVIRGILNPDFNDVEKFAVVTSTTFTSKAHDKAEDASVRLITGEEFATMLNMAGVNRETFYQETDGIEITDVDF